MDWKIEGDNGPEDYSSDKVSWLLKKGLSIGKTILVTGIVISTAPIVLPPLVVISAVGIAVSIPYGVFLASYACTQNLMAFLLPKPFTPLMEEYRALTYEEKVIQEDDEVEEAPRGEILEVKIQSINEGEDEKQKIDGNGENGREIEVIALVFEEDKVNAIKAHEESPEETTRLVDKIRDGEDLEESHKKVEDQDKVNDAKIQEELAKETTGLVEKIRDQELGDSKKKEKGKNLDQDMNKVIENQVIVSREIIKNKTIQNKNGTQEAYEEKKIWEEINALRTIVGYKAPLRSSAMEELKALYRFTGIEPPASVKDPSDLGEVTNKLRSLMAVVGVN